MSELFKSIGEDVRTRHHIDSEPLRVGRRSHGHGSEIVEQADYAVELVRSGVTDGVRNQLVEHFGRVMEWTEVCRVAHDIWKVALDYYE